VFLSKASIVPRPIPEVEPTKTAVSTFEGIELLAARTALIVTMLLIGNRSIMW